MSYHTDAAALRRRLIEWLFLLLGLLIVAAALAYAHLAEAARHDAAERERLSVLTALLAKISKSTWRRRIRCSTA